MAEPDYSKIYSIVPLFKSLSQEELGEMVKISRLFRVQKDTTVLREGEASGGMYVLVDGEVRIEVRMPWSTDQILAILKRGDVFGELSLIDDSPRSATAITTRESVLYQIDTSGFNRLRAAMNPAAFKVLREIAPVICDRIRGINERIANILSDPQKYMKKLEKMHMAKEGA